MSERLRQFVLDVSKDPERAKRLTADPAAELDRSALSPEEKEIILSRNPDVLRQALGPEHAEMLSMNSFFREPATTPAEPTRTPERRPGRPRRRAPARRAPAKRTPGKKAPAKKRARKTPKRKGAAKRPARKTARKGSRKGSRSRRG